jgi:hypothetical protein
MQKQKQQAMMFLKGFGYDQCDVDVTIGSHPGMKEFWRKDVVKQPSILKTSY